MDYKESVEYIHSLMRFGSKPGLERITELLKKLDNPQDNLEVIHVAGTNGKGSICTMISNILRCQGKKTGLYISPFVTCFNERIQIDGEYISNDDLTAYVTRVKKYVDEIQNDEGCPITEFEFITAVAFLYFYEKNCDTIVLEVGLGGRLDATNVIGHPKVSVIARIALDHTDILGDTEEKIALEKCGIIKQNCPTVTSTANSTVVLQTIERCAKQKNSSCTVCNIDDAKIIKSNIFGNSFVFGGREYTTKLAGEHQVSNALLAITAVNTAYPEIDDEIIRKGLKKTTFPARCEVLSRKPLVILDGSHNPNGTGALAKVLSSSKIKNATAIVGFMADKDVKEALLKLRGIFSKIIAVNVKSNKRSMSAEDLAKLCKSICENVSFADSYEEALRLAKAEETLIIFGSLYLAGDIRPIILSQISTKKQ